MISDHINNISRYNIPNMDKILHYLSNNDPKQVADGEHEIDGRNLFVRVMSYEPKPAAENKFETHQVYADLQFVASGIELMQLAPADQLTPLTAYDAAGDYHFFSAKVAITDLVVREGEFTVFFPGEAHRPSCRYADNTNKVKKLVFKIKIN